MFRTNNWRKRIFEQIVAEIKSPWLTKIQPHLRIWHTDIIEDLNPEILSLSDLGTLMLKINTRSGETITCSLYMCLCEIRVGLVIPNVLLDGDRRDDRCKQIAEIVPDKTCVIKAAASGTATLFDFVFRDEWVATSAVMHQSMSDILMEDGLADAISKMMQHLIINGSMVIAYDAPLAALAA